MRLTSDGAGRTPLWVFSYASMTSAAAPAVSGDDWLVPPKFWIPDGEPLSAEHSSYLSRSGVQSAQPRSPGATRSGTVLPCVTPPELIAEMLLFSQVPLENWRAPAASVCRYDWKVVVAPTAMTDGSDEGEPMV